MGNDIISESENLKYLGIYINNNLSWQPQIKQIEKKLKLPLVYAEKQWDQAGDCLHISDNEFTKA